MTPHLFCILKYIRRGVFRHILSAKNDNYPVQSGCWWQIFPRRESCSLTYRGCSTISLRNYIPYHATRYSESVKETVELVMADSSREHRLKLWLIATISVPSFVEGYANTRIVVNNPIGQHSSQELCSFTLFNSLGRVFRMHCGEFLPRGAPSLHGC